MEPITFPSPMQNSLQIDDEYRHNNIADNECDDDCRQLSRRTLAAVQTVRDETQAARDGN